MALDLRSCPNAIPWPPVLFGGSIIISLALQGPEPWSLGHGWPMRIGGAILLGVGLGLHRWAVTSMREMRTNIAPNRAADTLIGSGPFLFSRNPLYLGDAIAILGLGLAINSTWAVLAAPWALAFVWVFAIRREEAHMALRFGLLWDRYATRTPRWIGIRSLHSKGDM